MAKRHVFALAKQNRLLKRAEDIAFGKGAVPTPDGFYQLQLNTSVGLLRLSFTPGHAIASVFCRFDEPDRAVKVIGAHAMNRYSGKWNWHWSKDDNHDIALSQFQNDLTRLTVIGG